VLTVYGIQIEAAQAGIPDWCVASGSGGNGVYFGQFASVGDKYFIFGAGDAALTLLTSHTGIYSETASTDPTSGGTLLLRARDRWFTGRTTRSPPHPCHAWESGLPFPSKASMRLSRNIPGPPPLPWAAPSVNHSILGCLLALFLCLPRQAGAAAPAPTSFNREVRPILSQNCFLCHGPDAGRRKGKLRLDLREQAVQREAFVPGKPQASELVRRIFATKPEDLMPPEESNKTLSGAQKEVLRRWIAEGAKYEGHWAYEAPRRPSTPAQGNPIDWLVQKRLRALHLSPAAEADPRTLMRRLQFDLLGLPPEPEAVEAFVRDPSPRAYGALVEKLLASPHYGERMAIGWLDAVRFADTIGYHSDNPRNVWPYRDYVIRAFNDNKPFDVFTREQLAGDLLPESGREQKVGSAFNRLLLSTEEGGAQPKDYEARMLTDRVRAVGAVWLGQTIGCAQCHDHKFDPITSRDFYSLGAFFADIKEPIVGAREPGLPLPDEAQARTLATLEAAVKVLESDYNAPHEELKEAFETWKQEASRKDKSWEEFKKTTPQLAEVRTKLTAARKAWSEFETALPHCLVSVADEHPRTVRILPRGNFLVETGDIVQPAFPEYLRASWQKLEKPRLTRLDLADWLISPENPLTARVLMNRLWMQFFGAGLARPLDDFGAQGDAPRNPELLDWLACEFRDSGWDFKHMVRLLVNTRTYRQASTPSRKARTEDPYNREFSAQGRWRLEAELVRDNALAVAGLLVPQIGGPSVKPYQPEGYWENLNFPARTWQPGTGDALYRRGLYTWWQRSYLHPSLLAFDAPTREECCAERNRSNIPQQALVLLNDPTYVEAARVLAARALVEGGRETESRLRWAWRRVMDRAPLPAEIATARALLAKHLAEYQRDPQAAEALERTGATSVPAGCEASELAAWTSVTRVLLNLHETITRN